MSAIDAQAVADSMQAHNRTLQQLSASGVGPSEQLVALATVLGAMLAGVPQPDAALLRQLALDIVASTERRARAQFSERPAA
jgi:hypothetical protein